MTRKTLSRPSQSSSPQLSSMSFLITLFVFQMQAKQIHVPNISNKSWQKRLGQIRLYFSVKKVYGWKKIIIKIPVGCWDRITMYHHVLKRFHVLNDWSPASKKFLSNMAFSMCRFVRVTVNSSSCLFVRGKQS